MALTYADVDWNKIPKNAISILKILRNNEKSKYKPLDLADKVSQNPRTVRYALKKLLDLGYVSREPDLEDLRTFYYFVQSEEMIEQAREFCKENEIEVILKVADVLDTGYPNKYFDYIIYSKTLQHLKKKKHLESMLEVKRILKDGGKCFIACWNKNSEKHINGPKEKMIPWTYRGETYERYYYLFDEKELIDLVKEAGFKVEKVLSEWDSQNICLIISF